LFEEDGGIVIVDFKTDAVTSAMSMKAPSVTARRRSSRLVRATRDRHAVREVILLFAASGDRTVVWSTPHSPQKPKPDRARTRNRLIATCAGSDSPSS
jgi:hypothetical protein